jgi:hypothetical protein
MSARQAWPRLDAIPARREGEVSMGKRSKIFATIAVVTAAFVVALGAVALADLQQVDNDFSTSGLQNSHDFGSVSPGQALSTTAQVAINYQGNTHLSAEDVVPFDVSAGQTDLPAGYSVSSVSITIPSPWNATAGPDGNGLVGDTSTINFNAPATAGPFSFTVKYAVGSPHPACVDANPSCLTDSAGGGPAFTVTGTVAVASCTPTYSAHFLPPFDGVYPGSNLITNTMKNGRTVPVKTTIFDSCTNDYVTNLTGQTVSILVALNPSTTSTSPTDPVESYSDAGTSNANTDVFRWTADATVAGGGFWIYNLDSKGLGLVTANTYKVSIHVDSTLATGYALLKPVK